MTPQEKREAREAYAKTPQRMASVLFSAKVEETMQSLANKSGGPHPLHDYYDQAHTLVKFQNPDLWDTMNAKVVLSADGEMLLTGTITPALRIKYDLSLQAPEDQCRMWIAADRAAMNPEIAALALKTATQFGQMVGGLTFSECKEHLLETQAYLWELAKSSNLANTASPALCGLISLANIYEESGGKWIQISPYGEFAHERGLQCVDQKSAEAMVREFNKSTGGIPFYVGHPDCPELSREYKDKRAYGWVKRLEARGDGLYGEVQWSEPGQALIANSHYKYFSPFWDAEESKGAGKRSVWKPVKLRSLGLTNQPNLPVRPLSNSTFPPYVSPIGGETSDEYANLGLPDDAGGDSLKIWKAAEQMSMAPENCALVIRTVVNDIEPARNISIYWDPLIAHLQKYRPEFLKAALAAKI